MLNAGCGPQDFCMGDNSKEEEGQNPQSSRDPDTHRIIKLPDQILVQPTKVIHTEEIQKETVINEHYLERHIWPPTEGHPPVYLDKYFVKTRKL